MLNEDRFFPLPVPGNVDVDRTDRKKLKKKKWKIAESSWNANKAHTGNEPAGECIW